MVKKSNFTITNLRAIAIMIVIIGHSIILYDSSWGFYSSDNHSLILENLKHIINLFQMPLFFSISGFCFYYSKDFNIKKKIKRLIIPFIVVFIIWVIPFRIISRYPLYENYNLLQIVYNGIIGKDCGHLWYLMSLFEMYIIFNIVIKMNNKIINYIFALVVLLLSFKVSILPNVFQLQSTFKYFVFFILGYYLNKFSIKISKKKCFLIIVGIIALLTSYLLLNINTKLITKIIEFILPLMLLLSLYNIVPNKKIGFLNYISENSFGLYLFHSPMLYPIFNYAPNINIIIMLINNIIIIPIICISIIALIRKIKISFIIGE